VSQTSVKHNECLLAGCVVPVLQNGALKWKKKLNGVRSRVVASDHTLKCGLMPQVQYRKFWECTDGKGLPTGRTVLTWAHQPLTCSHSWRNRSVGNTSEAWGGVYWGDPSNHTHQRRRPIRNTRLAQTLGRCDKAQWRLHWRHVNVFCKINSFLKRKRTVCRTFEMTHVCMYVCMYIPNVKCYHAT